MHFSVDKEHTNVPRSPPTRQHTHSGLSSFVSTSSKSSYASSGTRYPSGITNITSFSSGSHDSHISNAQNISNFQDDQFDIIDSLDYDDVDDGLIDHELVHQKREAFVQQLFFSEQAYLESLNLIKRVFLDPLRKDSKNSSFSFLGMKKMVCTDRETRWLFGNFDTIYDIHQKIHTSLQQRMEIWGPTQIFSDVFKSWLPSLVHYHAYLDNYDIAVTTYERLMRYQPFKKFVETAHKDQSLKGATLLSLLQIPAGCISRYALIMTRLADTTSPMHPDYAGLLSCKKQIISLAEEIKIKVQDADNVDQVLMIHQALVGAPFGVKAQRRLVLQGQLSRVTMNSKMADEQTYLLFSDLLVIVRPKQETKKTVLQYKNHIVLDRAQVRTLLPSEAGGREHCIEIVSSFQGIDTLNTTYMGSPTVYVLQTNGPIEQQEWFTKIEVIINRLDEETKMKNLAASKRLAQSRSPPHSVRRLGTTSSDGSSRASKGSAESTKSNERSSQRH
ncbi:Dbl homology domain-containing protein [Phycomyces nitens]|nr:Dbl homology domain-containing protein [Phycomyces nitens]